MAEMALIIVGAIFVNNVVFTKFLGICPYLGVSKKIDTAVGMSMAVVFVLTLAGAITYILQYYVLVPIKMEYLQTIVFILVIASLVQLVEIVMKKVAPALYKALGIFLPLITTNCAILGIAILSVQSNYNFLLTVVFSFASAIGFGVALILFAGIRETLEIREVPKVFAGAPIALIIAGILAMAFMGFAGMVK
ncbi:MAG: electron transport complex subunit RsxA [Calditrichaceae bacterium]|nr:electron transport complex subunit RsxA [Calditrichaceae bacterium]MBN2709630.1 electron transport complex subunit RsxA [Calditrichaceae bacterium]RQV92426.1 MAG: electron transport complex subunit RsxA [Calditrichota bacterium]